MEVFTIYKAYLLGLCKGIQLQNMAKNMVQYLHFRILEFPLMMGQNPVIWLKQSQTTHLGINLVSYHNSAVLDPIEPWFNSKLLMFPSHHVHGYNPISRRLQHHTTQRANRDKTQATSLCQVISIQSMHVFFFSFSQGIPFAKCGRKTPSGTGRSTLNHHL